MGNWGLKFAYVPNGMELRRGGSWWVTQGSSSLLSSVIPASLEWASQDEYVYVLTWKVKNGACGIHFLSLIAGLLNERWGPLSPPMPALRGLSTELEEQFPPVFQPHVSSSSQPWAGHVWLRQPESRNRTCPPGAHSLVERVRHTQRVIRARRKAGARKHYREIEGKVHTNTCTNAQRKVWKFLGEGILDGCYLLCTCVSFLI